jgi:hypothetical protein
VRAIEWTALDPHTFEDTVAMLLCATQHRDADLVRPSRGDRGIDVYVPLDAQPFGMIDVFQVKYFPGKLQHSRRKQIVDSLTTAIDKVGSRINSWHLVVPMNATPEDLDWFQAEVQARAPFPCRWNGLAFVGAMVAEKPAVVDYHLFGDRRRVERRLHEAATVFELGHQATTGTLSAPGLAQAAAELLRGVNDDDPHFRYEIHVGQQLPAPPNQREWGFIGQTTSFDGENHITVAAYARYKASYQARQLPSISLNVIAEQHTELWRAVQDFVQYGSSVTIPSDRITKLSIDLGPLPPPDRWENLEVRLQPLPVQPDYPLRHLKLSLQPADCEDTVELYVEVLRRGRGIGAVAGATIEGRQLDGDLEFAVRLDGPVDPSGNVNVAFPSPFGKPLSRVLSAARFAHAFREGASLTVASLVGQPLMTIRLHGGDMGDPPVTDGMLEFLEAIEVLEKYADRRLSVPSEVTACDVREFIVAARLLRGERVMMDVDNVSLTLEPGAREHVETLLRMGGALVIESDASFEHDDIKVPLGRLRQVIADAHMREEPNWATDGPFTVVLETGENKVGTQELVLLPLPRR